MAATIAPTTVTPTSAPTSTAYSAALTSVTNVVWNAALPKLAGGANSCYVRLEHQGPDGLPYLLDSVELTQGGNTGARKVAVPLLGQASGIRITYAINGGNGNPSNYTGTLSFWAQAQ